ncbi:hypothetical protein Celaphus_00015450 [Cervus elaphus hippelaphus]|uniref:Uncharacterized protein n=1 Tax=Cervus elaphus hippelaphus TaxID=46360 RepID=A0A212CT59_CEREH|nr:hypothetical protein Celaphus_00015450 [Cervus elaphus hippelaphus]
MVICRQIKLRIIIVPGISTIIRILGIMDSIILLLQPDKKIKYQLGVCEKYEIIFF